MRHVWPTSNSAHHTHTSPSRHMVVAVSRTGEVSQQQVEGKMNTERYCQILGDTLAQSAGELRLGIRFIYQQDEPEHIAKDT